ncbi:MAG: tRNA (N6-isopentenyl adenosine(37)-C2)-methylthiotransferase MiaB [Oscillospiraceae bacterium]|nr:tRNA (N6-isopentenyl adenosine(37)-C2)-methylthiotransferase MiaB [Oscillospiraceae bacterium]
MSSAKAQDILVKQQEYSVKVRELLMQRYTHMPLAHVHSFGCQQNISDGEHIKGMLAQMGYGFTDSPDDADFVLYNTCAVRENAEDRVFGNVGNLVHCKRRKPDMVIALCGCMTQQEHIAQKVKKSYPHVNLVFGTHVTHTLPEMLYKTLVSHKRTFDLSDDIGFIVEGIPVHRDGNIKAWLPIMQGCDNFCTYCIVPHVRGREKSRSSRYIIEEARQLVADGYKEITLLGQNVNSYGKGLDEDINFSKLLRMINDIPGDFRIRFMTSHPKDCTRELIDTIAECDKVCNNIHLPVQCGSNRVLKEMNRHYTVEAYLELIDYAKKKIPGLTLTSDIIVGFPGETYEEFCETLELIKKVRYTNMYTFIYSPRNGTRAAKMPDPATAAEKSKWFREMLDVQAVINQELMDSKVGTVQRVLVDGIGKTGAPRLAGRSDDNTIVEFDGSSDLIGKFVNVQITKALNWAVFGEII